MQFGFADQSSFLERSDHDSNITPRIEFSLSETSLHKRGTQFRRMRASRDFA